MRTYPLYIGCTTARHKTIGIDAVVNARAGEQWRNDLTLDEIELRRDGRAIKDRLQKRVRFYQVNSKFFRRHINRISHLLTHYDDYDEGR